MGAARTLTLARDAGSPPWAAGRACAIANPRAGAPGHAERVAQRLRAAGLVHMVVVTPECGSPAAALRAHPDDDIVVVGGDGTVAQVLATLDRAHQRLAVLPCGHGNCLARDLGMADLDTAVQTLALGRTRWIDLLEVQLVQADGARRSVLAASTIALGYVTDVVRYGRGRLSWLGRRAYAAAALLMQPRRLAVRVQADGAPAFDGTLTGVVINNTAHLANFRGLPDARLDDGRLDLLLLDAGWRKQVLHNLAAAFGKGALRGRLMRQATSVEVQAAAPTTLMVDGELIDDVVQVSVRCLPRALCCFAAPADGTR